MSVFSILLNTYRLGALHPVVYRGHLGDEMPAGSSASYPEKSGGGTDAHLHGGGLDEKRTSYLGTPVFCDIAFNRDKGRDPFKITTCLIDVMQTKNIVTTAVQGRNGTIKEYVADGDYEISIKGALVGNKGYPRADVRDLHELLKQSTLLEVVSDYLMLFDIKEIVVTNYAFRQQEGYQNVQLFEITAISDDSKYRLILND
jgi:Domain of unknown function (DUF6046)